MADDETFPSTVIPPPPEPAPTAAPIAEPVAELAPPAEVVVTATPSIDSVTGETLQNRVVTIPILDPVTGAQTGEEHIAIPEHADIVTPITGGIVHVNVANPATVQVEPGKWVDTRLCDQVDGKWVQARQRVEG